MSAGPDNAHRRIAASLIQIPAVDGAALGKFALIIAPSHTPFAGSLFLTFLPDRLDQFGYGVDLRRQG